MFIGEEGETFSFDLEPEVKNKSGASEGYDGPPEKEAAAALETKALTDWQKAKPGRSVVLPMSSERAAAVIKRLEAACNKFYGMKITGEGWSGDPKQGFMRNVTPRGEVGLVPVLATFSGISFCGCVSVISGRSDSWSGNPNLAFPLVQTGDNTWQNLGLGSVQQSVWLSSTVCGGPPDTI